MNHLQQLNKLVKEAKASEDWGLTFKPVELETAKILVFSDSSWANASELRSQAGFMVLIAGAGVCEPERGHSQPDRLAFPIGSNVSAAHLLPRRWRWMQLWTPASTPENFCQKYW